MSDFTHMDIYTHTHMYTYLYKIILSSILSKESKPPLLWTQRNTTLSYMHSSVGCGTNTLKLEYNIIKKQMKHGLPNDGVSET